MSPDLLPLRLPFTALLSVVLAACGRDNSGGAHHSDSGKEHRTDLRTQAITDPCGLVPRTEVERLLGKLTGDPRPDKHGEACVYSLTSDRGARDVAIGISLGGAQELEQATGMLGQQVDKELGTDGSSSSARKPSGGWDYVGGLPGTDVWRVGHLAVQISGETFLLPAKKLDTVAALVRDRIPDRPFAARGADPNATGSGPDPCALLTRIEAESVLGVLAAPPYRSQESSALADGEGPSCSYYTPGHRALVLTPTRSDGKMMFGMVSRVGGVITSKLGVGGQGADTLDGPWDQAASGVAGSLYFLKGDQMLEVGYRTSSTDAAGATRLASYAVGRMQRTRQ